MRSDESSGTAFPAAVAVGVIAMALSEGLGWRVDPPLAFLVFFVATLLIVLPGIARDATDNADDHPSMPNEPRGNVDLGKLR